MPNNHSKRTQVIYGEQSVLDAVSQFLSRQETIDLCGDSKTIARVHEIYKDISFVPKIGIGIKLRVLTDVNKDNISIFKELMKVTREVRHLKGTRANFAVRNTECISIANLNVNAQDLEQRKQNKVEEQPQQQQHQRLTQPQSHIVYSNDKEIIEQQQYIFNSLWEKSIPAEQRIKELEQGEQSDFFKVITDNSKISQILFDLVNSVANEMVLLLPNEKALIRIDRMGIIDRLIKASQSGATIKIICPLSNKNAEIQKKIAGNAPEIVILSCTNSRHGLYIVDSCKFLRVELVKPEAENFLETIGFAVYS